MNLRNAIINVITNCVPNNGRPVFLGLRRVVSLLTLRELRIRSDTLPASHRTSFSNAIAILAEYSWEDIVKSWGEAWRMDPATAGEFEKIIATYESAEDLLHSQSGHCTTCRIPAPR